MTNNYSGFLHFKPMNFFSCTTSEEVTTTIIRVKDFCKKDVIRFGKRERADVTFAFHVKWFDLE